MKWVRKNIEENIKKYNRLIFNEYHIGYIYFHPTGLKMELDGLFLFTEYRGKGVGKEIVLKCIDESRTSIFLFVYKENIPAVTLYTNIGFEIKRVLPDSRYLMEFNKKSNIINTL